jgi:hypothetical protein
MYAKQADALGYPNIVYVPTGSGQGPSSRVEARAPATEAAINNTFQDTCKWSFNIDGFLLWLTEDRFERQLIIHT